MNSYWTLHSHKLLFCAIALMIVTGMNLMFGHTKSFSDITWIDIFGEGSAFLLVLAFYWFIVHSRPLGRTSNYLAAGLIGFACVMCQDLIDEIIVLDHGYWFDDVFESALAPIALISMAYGLYLWDQEQRTINQKLQTRERYYREHSALDYTTDLYTALYMKEQLKRELQAYKVGGKPFSLGLIDLQNFDGFNRRYGMEDGNRLLQHVANLISGNLRITDLACRYAGDRFIILFPDTHSVDAEVYLSEIEHALKSLAFKPGSAARSVHVQCSIGLIDHTAGSTSEEIFQKLNRHLEEQKHHSNHKQKVA